MTLTLPSGPAPWLTPLVDHRLEVLGPGRIVDRATIHAVAESARAGDQFLYAAVQVGLLVPTAWGRYAVPRGGTIELLRRIPDPAWAVLVSHAQTLPWVLNETGARAVLLGFLAARLGGRLRFKGIGSAPVYSLPADADGVPVVPLQGSAFLVDSLEPSPEFVDVGGGTRPVRVPVPSPPDTVRLFQSSLDPRLTGLSHEILEQAPGRARAIVRDTKPRWSPAQPMPQPSRALRQRAGAGPPNAYRLLAPAWYLGLARGAAQAIQRRMIRVA